MDTIHETNASPRTLGQQDCLLERGTLLICFFIIPCYNEEAVLKETAHRLRVKLESLIESERLAPKSRILFVDDGSSDATWGLIRTLAESNELFSGIKLSRNKGHQNALYAGLMSVVERCDISISLDADLQDDIEVIDDFIAKYKEGCQVVFGVRRDRETDSTFKRQSAGLFYRLMKFLGTDVLPNHADYRLLSKKALVALSCYPEVNLFLRGLVTDLGLKTGIVYYSRKERFAGESKYPLRKMISFAVDGITSFSSKPLRLILSLGLVIAAISLLGLCFTLISFFLGTTVSGWTTTLLSIWFLGGFQVFCLGIIGEYIGKTYFEVKRRPKYLIEEEV